MLQLFAVPLNKRIASPMQVAMRFAIAGSVFMVVAPHGWTQAPSSSAAPSKAAESASEFAELPPAQNDAIALDSSVERALLEGPASSGGAADQDPFADLFLEHPSDIATPPSATAAVDTSSPPAEQVSLPPLAIPLFPSIPSALGYEVLVAAPVHEALLGHYELSLQTATAVQVASAPPPPVNEQPPLASSDVPAFVGNNVQWISGYWAWLADASKYVWISGLYRDVPPGRMWQPGQWVRTVTGYRWDAGYWAEASAMTPTDKPRRLAVSAPPQPPELPSRQPPPNLDSFWIPGIWLPASIAAPITDATRATAASPNHDYHWQNGFWATRSAQWIWQPARYVRVRDDYEFVSGYWDYEPQFRGQAFAAVDFENSPDSAASNYRPAYPLCRPCATLLHLFCKSDSPALFYGDLYDDRYAELGYRPWCSTAEGTDLAVENQPLLLSFYVWKYRAKGIDFLNSMTRFEQHFRLFPSIRPAAQLAATPRLVHRDGIAGAVYADSFEELVQGVVGGQPAVQLAGAPSAVTASRSASKPALSEVENVGSFGPSVPALSAVTAASAVGPMNINIVSPPPGAAPLGLPGTSGWMVLPGGRIIAAPVAIPMVSSTAVPIADAAITKSPTR